MNVERLKKLKEVLQQVIAEKIPFDMGCWACLPYAAVESLSTPDLLLGTDIPVSLQNYCGTTACAAGWYVELAKPNDLRLSIENFDTLASIQHRITPDSPWRHGNAFHILAEHFGISHIASRDLFDESTYGMDAGEEVTPKHVIERIDDLLATA